MNGAEILVIGGGLAGASAAIRLAEAGRRVTLFEKQPAAHDKVCGEFLSIETQSEAAALGLDLPGLGAMPIDRVRVRHGARHVETALPFHALSLSRRVLDEALLERAAQAGVTLHRGVCVTALERCGDDWQATLAGGGTATGRTVFLATGKHALRGHPRSREGDAIGFKQLFRQAGGHGGDRVVELLLFDGGYAGIEAVGEDHFTLCLALAKSAYTQWGGWEALIDALRRASPALDARLAAAQACWPRPLAIAAIPYGFLHRPSTDDPKALYRVGDQLAVIPSFTGDGMAIALHSGRRAAESYLRGLAAMPYHRAMHRELSPQMRRAARLARLVSHPAGPPVALAALRLAPGLLRRAARQTRLESFSMLAD